MSGFLTHAGIRLQATLRDPLALSILVFSGLASLLYWPGLTDSAGSGWTRGDFSGPASLLFANAGMLLMLFVWSMLVSSAATGRVAHGRRAAGSVGPALPALPVGARSRALADAIIALAIVLAVRAPALFLGEWAHRTFAPPVRFMGEGAYRLQFVEHSLAGALIMLPFLLIWQAPARTFELQKARPLLWVAFFFLAMKLGLLETLAGCAATSLALSALALFVVGRELHMPLLWRRPVRDPASRQRRHRHPDLQLRRDQWLRPLPVVALFVAIEAGLIAGDRWFGLPRPFLTYGGILIGATLLGWTALRPLGSKLAIAGLSGAPGYRPGEFAAAWAVLPVRREALLRGVYLHGLIFGALSLIALFGSTALLYDSIEGSEARNLSLASPFVRTILLPQLALIPCLAGVLTAGAAGDKRRTYVSGGALLLVMHLNIVLLLLKVPAQLRIGTLIGLALVGGLLPLVHLLPPQAEKVRAPAEPGGAGGF
jgi:hypothetical protein